MYGPETRRNLWPRWIDHENETERVPIARRPEDIAILVTGGAGYLGSVLCERLLAAGCRVTTVDNMMYQQQSLLHLCANPDFDFVPGDVRDEGLMGRLVKQADVLIPLAAIVGAPACDRDPLLSRSVNLEAIGLLNRLRSRHQLVVYPTTNSGYGTQSGNLFCTEDTPLEPISLTAGQKPRLRQSYCRRLTLLL